MRPAVCQDRRRLGDLFVGDVKLPRLAALLGRGRARLDELLGEDFQGLVELADQIAAAPMARREEVDLLVSKEIGEELLWAEGAVHHFPGQELEHFVGHRLAGLIQQSRRRLRRLPGIPREAAHLLSEARQLLLVQEEVSEENLLFILVIQVQQPGGEPPAISHHEVLVASSEHLFHRGEENIRRTP